MRISDWSSDVCSSDLGGGARLAAAGNLFGRPAVKRRAWPLALLAPLLVGAEKPTLVPDVSQRDIEIAYSFTGAELLLFGAILYPGGRVPDAKDAPAEEIGRASWWARGCQYVSILVVADSFKKKTKQKDKNH